MDQEGKGVCANYHLSCEENEYGNGQLALEEFAAVFRRGGKAAALPAEYELWGTEDIVACNDSIANLNYERVQTMDLRRNLTPAILSYEGIQFQYMAPGVFEDGQFAYIQEHLRILSGFYGLLRPFDGVTPYRLEMRAKLPVDGKKDLYAFWGEKLAQQLCIGTDLILNLASKEYSKAVSVHLPKSVRFLRCTFGEWKGDKVIEKGTMCKMARGEMVRWLAGQNITHPEAIKGFDRLGYTYQRELSGQDNFVFIKERTRHGRKLLISLG